MKRLSDLEYLKLSKTAAFWYNVALFFFSTFPMWLWTTFILGAWNGIKKIGMVDMYNFDQSFADGIIHELVIPDSVETIYPNSFNWRTEYLSTIYCEASSQPSGWLDGWHNQAKAQVIWGYTE